MKKIVEERVKELETAAQRQGSGHQTAAQRRGNVLLHCTKAGNGYWTAAQRRGKVLLHRTKAGKRVSDRRAKAMQRASSPHKGRETGIVPPHKDGARCVSTALMRGKRSESRTTASG